MASIPASSSALLALVKRQTGTNSNIPAQCESGCTSIFTTIDNCVGTSCLCTAKNIAAYQSCINCVVADSNGAQASEQAAQNGIDELNAECAGQSVASLTIATPGAASTGNPLKTNGDSSNAAMGVAGLVGLAAFHFTVAVL
ncbi:hypothetical protein HWV62_2045 [Athelia sp. TMB]|nr:hypothetical protein HWV62_2045 [Athelia sp. TMB]